MARIWLDGLLQRPWATVNGTRGRCQGKRTDAGNDDVNCNIHGNGSTADTSKANNVMLNLCEVFIKFLCTHLTRIPAATRQLISYRRSSCGAGASRGS